MRIKSKSKKSVLYGLTLLLSAGMVLSACGKNADNGGNTAASNSNTETSTEKPVELIWYTIGTPQKDVDKVMAEVNKYTSEKIGVTVKMNMLDWGDYDQKMKVMTASGEPMDIMFSASWAFDYVQNSRKGAFASLDELLQKEGKGITEVLDPAFLQGSKVDGHNYGIPANKELPAQEVWRFNKNLLDKYKLDIKGVGSLESLEPLLKTIKANEPTVTPFALDKNYVPYVPYDYIIQGLPMGVKLDSTDLKVVNVLETPEMKQALQTMRKYYKAGYVSAEAATTTSVSDLQTAGKWFLDRAATQPFADNAWSSSYGYPVVSTPASDSIIYNWSVMGSLQTISANSEHPDKAMAFLNLLNTDPYLRNLVDSGIEGVHYKKTADNRMENLADSKNYDMPTFSLGNIMLTYLNPSDPDNKWESFKEFNSAGKKAPTLGFNFDSSKVATELAAVQNVKEEFMSALYTGTVEPDEYLPKAVEKLNAAGFGKIIEEAQRQLDEWKAAQ
ncbi:ABC transporter substrate-binding protein [Paenibacillus montanisoli]|uniref:ABC transporter substrate-binding protein n=1 Tax=Paenibacillus montanisoli TaxID=2081970 RepID=A0A328U2S7_9BACL|nr:ABC transporter substrate-binding protein [Paenibacillus montanisoli]RAP75195.1 ABC transporter substrate-binding protein [Paenibacillus montanisoli]